LSGFIKLAKKMEKDTVLLDVEKYNELRDFKQKIEEGYTLTIASSNFYYDRRFITTDKAVEEVVSANKELQKQIEDLRNGNQNKELPISEIKKMSIWQFFKWRKS